MNDFATSTLSGLLGALFGAGVAYLLTRQSQRVSFAFDMHKEFNTVEMGRHRYKAELLLKRYPYLSFEQLGKVDTSSMDSLYVILGFYQRVSLAVKYGQIHKKLVLDMFTTNYYYWYYAAFEPGFVQHHLNGSEHLVYLADWMYRSTELSRHQELKLNSQSMLASWKNDDNLPTPNS